MPATAPLMTAEELLRYDSGGHRTELVRGQLLVREPPGLRHGDLMLRLGVALHEQVQRLGREQGARFGKVFVGDSGFWIERAPDTVLGPDLAFVREEKLPTPIPKGFGEFAPDLVVELWSPSDRAGEALAKVAEWLNAGVALVWVISEARERAQVYRADGSTVTIGRDDTLDGEDVLPGFALRLGELLE